jgi:hypothetical protein
MHIYPNVFISITLSQFLNEDNYLHGGGGVEVVGGSPEGGGVRVDPGVGGGVVAAQ